MHKIIRKLDNIYELLRTIGISSKNILSMEEASKYTGFSLSTLYKHCHRKAIPHHKPSGGKVFFQKSDLDEFLLGNRIKSNQELDEELGNDFLND